MPELCQLIALYLLQPKRRLSTTSMDTRFRREVVTLFEEAYHLQLGQGAAAFGQGYVALQIIADLCVIDRTFP